MFTTLFIFPFNCVHCSLINMNNVFIALCLKLEVFILNFNHFVKELFFYLFYLIRTRIEQEQWYKIMIKHRKTDILPPPPRPVLTNPRQGPRQINSYKCNWNCKERKWCLINSFFNKPIVSDFVTFLVLFFASLSYILKA